MQKKSRLSAIVILEVIIEDKQLHSDIIFLDFLAQSKLKLKILAQENGNKIAHKFTWDV